MFLEHSFVTAKQDYNYENLQFQQKRCDQRAIFCRHFPCSNLRPLQEISLRCFWKFLSWQQIRIITTRSYDSNKKDAHTNAQFFSPPFPLFRACLAHAGNQPELGHGGAFHVRSKLCGLVDRRPRPVDSTDDINGQLQQKLYSYWWQILQPGARSSALPVCL